MSVETTVESARVRDAASCRAWLARLANDDARRLLQVDRLLRGLTRSTQAPDLVLEIAEQARPVHLVELGGVIDRLDASSFPLREPDSARLQTALESLRLGRNLFMQIHEALVEDAEVATRAVIPGAARSLSTVMPLARALDYQARLLLALQRWRIEVGEDEWNVLCLLARRLRASTFIDASLPDETPLLRSGTSRGLFVYPLLVWLAAPYTRNAAEFALVCRLARRWAGRVGFRLEEGSGSQETRYGPSVALTGRYTVRLVTHRLQRRIENRLQEIEVLGTRAVPRLPRGMTLAGTRRLLRELVRQWCEPRPVPREPDVPLGEMRLRFGFPVFPDSRGDGANARAGGQRAAAGGRAAQARLRPAGQGPRAWHSASSRAYIYGRFEHDTLIRRAIGVPVRQDPLAGWVAQAETARWVSIERQQAVFEGCLGSSGIELGALALLLPPAVAADGGATGGDPRSEPYPKRIFGRVVALSQQLAAEAGQHVRQRVSVAVWSGQPILVGVRSGDDPYFHDAFLLAPEQGAADPLCLIVPEGMFQHPRNANLREPDRDSRIRLEELLDRGPGYDRVRISRLPG